MARVETVEERPTEPRWTGRGEALASLSCFYGVNWESGALAERTLHARLDDVERVHDERGDGAGGQARDGLDLRDGEARARLVGGGHGVMCAGPAAWLGPGRYHRLVLWRCVRKGKAKDLAWVWESRKKLERAFSGDVGRRDHGAAGPEHRGRANPDTARRR